MEISCQVIPGKGAYGSIGSAQFSGEASPFENSHDGNFCLKSEASLCTLDLHSFSRQVPPEISEAFVRQASIGSTCSLKSDTSTKSLAQRRSVRLTSCLPVPVKRKGLCEKLLSHGYIKGRVIGKSETNNYATVFQLEAQGGGGRTFAAKCVEKEGYLTGVLSREYKILQTLAHPNIVKVHELIRASEGSALLMELCHGQALSKQIGTLAEQHRYCIVEQALSALVYLHITHQIAHKDIKLENIIVDTTASQESGADARMIVVKLIDFGSACFLDKSVVKNSADTHGDDSAELESDSDWSDTSDTSSFNDFDSRIVPPPSDRGRGSPCQLDIYALGLVMAGLLSGRAMFTRDVFSSTYDLQLDSWHSVLTREYVVALLSRTPDLRPDALTAHAMLPQEQHWASVTADIAAERVW